MWMLAWLVVGTAAVSTNPYSTVEAGLVTGPPKLETHSRSNGDVWFHIPIAGAPTKFTLECQAAGDPEKFHWEKNGEPFEVDGERVIWQKPGQSGTIIFLRPKQSDQGYYQCFVSNIFGTAVSNRLHVQLGVLDHFIRKELEKLHVTEGDPLTVPCSKPNGVPRPTVFWLYRDTKKTSVIETIRRKHITVDGDGNLQFSHVTAHDGRSNLIYQCAATSPVLQGEYRAGDEFQLVVSEDAYGIRPKEAEILWVSPSSVTVKAGEKLKLMCIFSGYPVPKVIWRKRGGHLGMDRIRDLSSAESDFGKSLIIHPVHPDDQGVYECSAQGVRHSMAVKVTAAPYWTTVPPVDVDRAEEKTAELYCRASGDPQPLIRWFMNGKGFDELPEHPTRMVLDGGRTLRLQDLNHDVDTGVYQCNASNPLGYVFANAFVNVRAHAPRFNMPLNRVFKVTTKTTIDMSCEVEAAPAPVVHWVDAKDHPIRIVSGKTELFPNNTLRITDASFTDDGLYYCNVTNKYGLNRASNLVQVFNPTYFTKIPSAEKRKLEAFDSVELECEAVSDKRLEIVYLWMRNGILIGPTEILLEDQHSEDDDEHYRFPSPNRLVLRKARGYHSGFYDCVAKTLVDERKSGAQLVVKDVPEAPRLTNVDCSERRALLRWGRAFDNHDPLTQYVVEMETEFHKGDWRLVLTEQNVNKESYEAEVSLTPWVNYTFRVVAVNSHGRSRPGYKANVDCQTLPSFPYKNPRNVTAEGTTPHNLVIRWEPMDKEEWNAPGFMYIVRYRQKNQYAQWTEFTVEDPLADHVVVRDQPTFREYEVQVRSKNNRGDSILAPTTNVGYSGEDKPEYPPPFFTANASYGNSTSVLFTWKLVDPGSVNGHFQGYQLQAWRLPDDTTDRRRKVRKAHDYLHDVLLATDSTMSVLYDFKPMGVYIARMFTVNKGYRSDPTPPAKFVMPEGVPSEVRNLDIRAVGARTILIEWDEPEVPRGQLRGYFLTFRNSTSDFVEETYVTNTRRHYLHETAEPNTEYFVAVWAETGGGEGSKVEKPVKTWPFSAPAKPSFQMDVLSRTSAKFTWLPVTKLSDEMPGSSFYLNYSEADSNRWIQTPALALPQQFVILEGLRPNQEYHIYAVAKDGNQTTSSELKRFFTRNELDPGLYASGLSSAAWFIAIVCALFVALLGVMVVCLCQRNQSGKYPVKRKEMERGHQLQLGDEDRSFMEYQYGGTAYNDSKEPIANI